MDVLLQDDTEIPSNLEEDEILDLAKLRFQAFCHQSGRFDMKKDIGMLSKKLPYFMIIFPMVIDTFAMHLHFLLKIPFLIFQKIILQITVKIAHPMRT